MATRIDFTDQRMVRALLKATGHMSKAYRLLRDTVGVDNPADNQFVREAQICVKAGVIWSGDRGGADGHTPDGREVEIKSTRLVEGKALQFPTSRYVSETVIARFKSAEIWLFGVFSVYEELLAVFRSDAKSVGPLIDDLERKLNERVAKGQAFENNSKFPLSAIRPNAELVYLHEDYEEFRTPGGRPSLRRKA